jgi:uncharacterized protein YdaU (DUF1376 family)
LNGLPYYKAYPRDFFEGTAGMPFELKATYRLLLDLIYMHGGRLVDDPRFIAGHIGCSVRAWNVARGKLISAGKITADLGIISNFRADKELESLRTFQDKQRQNGSKPKKINAIAQATAEPKPNHTEPDIDTDKKEEEPYGSSKKERVRASRLAKDWTLPPDLRQWALDQGLSPATIDREAATFADYWHARPGKDAAKLDWAATWRNWCRRATERGPPKTGHRPFDTAAAFARAFPELNLEPPQ